MTVCGRWNGASFLQPNWSADKKNNCVSVSCLPLSTLSLSTCHSPVLSFCYCVLSANLVLHILSLPFPCVSHFIIVSVSAVPGECIVTIPCTFPLFLSSFFSYVSLSSIIPLKRSCFSAVKWTHLFGDPSFLTESLFPFYFLFSAPQRCACVKSDHRSTVECILQCCAFFHSVCYCFCHSCFCELYSLLCDEVQLLVVQPHPIYCLKKIKWPCTSICYSHSTFHFQWQKQKGSLPMLIHFCGLAVVHSLFPIDYHRH